MWNSTHNIDSCSAGDAGADNDRIERRQSVYCSEKCEEQRNTNAFLQVLQRLDLDLCTQFDDAIGRYAEKVRRFCRVF